eukprot:scaffold54879_cov68-Phaeocystis_antarctica.AAC.6
MRWVARISCIQILRPSARSAQTYPQDTAGGKWLLQGSSSREDSSCSRRSSLAPFPSSHCEHVVLEELAAYVPLAQGMHSPAPLAANVPLRQGLHSSDRTSCWRSPLVPPGQSCGAGLPSGQNFPL